MHETSFGVLFQGVIYVIVVTLFIACNESVHAIKTGKKFSKEHHLNKRDEQELLPKQNATHELQDVETRNKRIVDAQLNQLRFNSPNVPENELLGGRDLGAGDPAVRHNLLSELEHHIQERNMLLRQSNLMRENELLREKELLQRPLISESNLLRRKSSIYNNGLFSQPTESLMFENQLANQMRYHDVPEEDTLLGQDHFLPNIGNLGDEAMPYGSLGEARSNYIPLGRISDQVIETLAMIKQLLCRARVCLPKIPGKLLNKVIKTKCPN